MYKVNIKKAKGISEAIKFNINKLEEAAKERDINKRIDVGGKGAVLCYVALEVGVPEKEIQMYIKKVKEIDKRYLNRG